MSGQIFTGKNGRLKIENSFIPIIEWTLTIKGDPVNTSDNSSEWETYEPAKAMSWSGSLKLYSGAGRSVTALNQKVRAEFYEDNLTASHSGDIIITSLNKSVQTRKGDAVINDYSFVGTGELTVGTPSE